MWGADNLRKSIPPEVEGGFNKEEEYQSNSV
jgi:hypothetical protein